MNSDSTLSPVASVPPGVGETGDAVPRADAGLRPPQQARSRRTLERIVEAAMELAREGGAGAVTVQRVVRRSGSSVGSFYARFRGKDDLLAYLAHRIWTEATRRWDGAKASVAWGELELEGRVRHAVALLVDAERGGGAELRLLDEARQRRGAAWEAFRGHVLEELVRVIGGAGGAGEAVEQAGGGGVGGEAAREDRIRLVLVAARGVIDRVDTDLPRYAERDALVGALSELVVRYLGGPADEGSSPAGDVELFDIWG